MNCSLAKFNTMIGVAIGLLALAVVGALIPFNVVGLIISIASVLTVLSIYLIPAMRDELKAYDTCMGPSTQCSVGPSIDLLGQAARSTRRRAASTMAVNWYRRRVRRSRGPGR